MRENRMHGLMREGRGNPALYSTYYFPSILGTAIRAGLNRNGPWAMARRLAAQSGMTNQWLKDQGLISVKELWVKNYCPATAR
jgi:hypothetical protein